MDPNDLASVTSAGAPVSDGTRTCPVTLIGGAGSCQITETAAGHYGLTASYGGSTNFDRSVSPPETVNVTFHPLAGLAPATRRDAPVKGLATR